MQEEYTPLSTSQIALLHGVRVESGGRGASEGGAALGRHGMRHPLSSLLTGVPPAHVSENPNAQVVLDDTDRKIIVALQVNSRASWRQVANVVGISETTAKRRVERLFRLGALHTSVLTPAMRRELYVLMQISCQLEDARTVAKTLAQREDTRFVALVTGPFDIVAECTVASQRDMAHLLLEEVPRITGIRTVSTVTEVRNFKTGYDWALDILGPKAADLAQPVSNGRTSLDFSEVDLLLIEALGRNGRASFSQLAAEVGISESMARRHVERLMIQGGVQVVTLVDPDLLGFGLELLLWIRVDLSRVEEVAQFLASRREVRYIAATYGHSELFCEVIMRSQEDVYTFMTGVLGSLPGVRQVDTASELSVLKRGHVHIH